MVYSTAQDSFMISHPNGTFVCDDIPRPITYRLFNSLKLYKVLFWKRPQSQTAVALSLWQTTAMRLDSTYLYDNDHEDNFAISTEIYLHFHRNQLCRCGQWSPLWPVVVAVACSCHCGLWSPLWPVVAAAVCGCGRLAERILTIN